MDFLKQILFWQPKKAHINRLDKNLIVAINYIIWPFLGYISLLLIIKNPHTFWQLLIATIIGEIIEKVGKKHPHISWKRPFIDKKHKVPKGLISSWYEHGSFPSGHSIKAAYFLMFIIQYQSFSPIIYCFIVLPFLIFRVIIGFHYPIDMLGGATIGLLLWRLTSNL